MISTLQRSLLWLMLAPAACAPPTAEPPDTGTCDATGGRSHWLVTDLRWGRILDGVSDGFDLDGDEGAGGCGGNDAVSPAGLPGIDNAFGGLLPVLELTEFSAAESIIAELIRTGEIMIVTELAGLDDPVDDPCVSFALRRGAGTPLLGSDGEPLALQTLDLDTSFDDQEFERSVVAGGSVQASPVSVTLPVQFLGADLEFEILNGAVRLDLHDDGTASGVLSGGLDVDDVVETIQGEGVAQELKDLADTALRLAADLAPDDTGTCTQLSLVLVFQAQPVFVYPDVFEAGP